MWASPAEIRNLSIRSGDLLISEGGDVGRAAIYDGEPGRIFQKSLHRARSLQGSDVRYLKYLLASLHSSGWLDILCNKATMAHFTAEKLGSLEIPCISIEEQRRIADFLDAETARIDQLMSGQLRVLELLEERANSRVLELIGQSPLVEQRGSELAPMRQLIRKLNRPTIPSGEVITAFRDGQVTSRSIRRREGYTLSASTDPQGQGVEICDIVVHGLDGFAGAIGDSEASGNCSPVYHVCTPIDGGNSAFYGRMLRLLALGDYLALFGASARERAVDFRNWKIFGQAPIPRVEPEMQHEIGNLITKVRPLREQVKCFNERLAERRQALITAAVTGQIDVTTAGGVAV
jgi:type I restriction enzyme S subunit